MNDWATAISELRLSSSEQEVVQRFKENPYSRSFLAIAEILIRNRIFDRAIGVLTEGIKIHPAYTVARVVLGQLYYQQGLFEEAWSVLEESPVALKANKSAQILRFALGFCLGDYDFLVVQAQDMIARQQFDAGTHDWIRRLETEEFNDLHVEYLDALKARGVPILDRYYPNSGRREAGKHDPVEPRSVIPGQSFQQPMATVEELTDPELAERHIDGFFVVPVHQIFLHQTKTDHDSEKPSHELDPMSLARVYKKQGHYEKALEVFRRLLYMAPNNDLLKKEVAQLEALREEQDRQEREFDPELAERLDEVRRIDRQIQTLNALIEVLDSHEFQRSS